MYELFFTLVCNTWKLFYCVKEKIFSAFLGYQIER